MSKIKCDCSYCDGDCANCICKKSCHDQAKGAVNSPRFKELMRKMKELENT